MDDLNFDARKAWTAAFVAASKAMPEIPKDKKATIPTRNGGGFEYSYADLPAIIAKVRPVLAEQKLAVAQSVEATPNGVSVTTRIYHEAGWVEEFGPVVMPASGDARAAGGAITYARRYGLCAALGIAADEDTDAAGAERNESPQPSWTTSEPVPSGGGETPGAQAQSSPSDGRPNDAALDLLDAHRLGTLVRAGKNVGIDIKSKADVERLDEESAKRIAAAALAVDA